MFVLLILYMGLMARLSGSGFGESFSMKWLPELLFALPIAVASYHIFDLGLFVFFTCWAWSYLWMETGHHDALDVGKEVNSNRQVRDNTLTPIALIIANKLKWSRDSLQYDLLFLSIKGFLMTLPICGIGFIFWPLGYFIGSNSPYRPDISKEILSGSGVAIGIIIMMEIDKWI